MHISDGFTREELEVRAQTTERILDEVRLAQRQSQIHLFLSYFYNAHFDPAGFDEIRHLGIPSVNFYCNSVYQFDLVAEIAAKADVSWHPERGARKLYLQVGARPVSVQMGADPNVYRPVPEAIRSTKACFVGQRYADRDRWLAHLSNAGIPVEMYGPGWDQESTRTEQSIASDGQSEYLGRRLTQPGTAASYRQAMRQNITGQGIVGGVVRTCRQLSYRRQTRKLARLLSPFAKGPIPFEKISGVFASYDVILNFSNVWADGRPGSKLIPHVRLRDFEAPMCRTCYLTGHTDEIGKFYDLGKEIDTYRTPDELIDKTQYYLRHPVEAEKLREAGYLRARKDHTWEQRFEELFRKTGMDAHG